MQTPSQDQSRRSEKESPYSILDDVLEGCQVIGRDWRYLYVNESVARQACLSRDELLGHTIQELYPGIEDSVMFRQLQECMRDGKTCQLENVFTYPDGTTGCFELRIQPVPEGLLIFSLDITNRKDMENELRLKKNQLELVLEGAELGTWDWDYRTGEVAFNRRWTEMLGYTPEEIVPHVSSWEKLIHPEDTTLVMSTLDKHLQGKIPSYETIHRLRHKSGDWIWVLDKGKVLEREKDGTPRRVCGTHLDLTERKLSQLRIEHLNNVLRTIREINRLIVHERDPDRLINQGCQLLNQNQGYASALIILTDEDKRPLSWGEAGLGASFAPLAAKLLQGEMPPCYEQCLSSGRVRILDSKATVCAPCPLSSYCEGMGMMCSPLVHDGADFGFMAVTLKENFTLETEEKDLFAQMATDLAFALSSIYKDRARRESERIRKELELQLAQARKMESIGTLAGGIAHDFNNILTAIIGFTELAMDDVEKGSPLDMSLGEIYTAGLRARDLVKQILTFARRSGEEIAPLRVSSITREVLKFIRSSIPATIEINLDIRSDSLIMGNATQVHQVLMNLCTNAAHAMEENGGILSVSLEDIVLRDAGAVELGLSPGQYVAVEVADTGVGIPPEFIESIFDPYFTTKEQGQGTGMGLALVHGIVESYGGRITVNSIPGQNTRFRVVLPATRHDQDRLPEERANAPGGRERILLVDDEAPLVRMGRRVLEQLGYKVTGMTSAVEALQLFGANPDAFDLVITDMTMPHLTGDVLAGRLMEIRPDIPVIICTGYNKKITPDVTSALGIKKVIFKPLLKGDLGRIVRTVLNECGSAVQRE